MSYVSSRTSGIIALHELPWSCLFQKRWFSSCKILRVENAVVAPTQGGSVPMYIFEDFGLPWIGVPIVNYDNHQHSSDEIAAGTFLARNGDLWGDFGGLKLVKEKRFNTARQSRNQT